MKLLLDQNLSPHLARRLQDLYPGSDHVFACGLDRAPDREVWEYARQYGFIIVTKDTDFGELGVLRGFPPIVVWVRRGNCSTREVEETLRRQYPVIAAACAGEETGIVEVW